MKKRALLSSFLCLLWTFGLTLYPLAADLPSPTDDFYVNDFAGVLSDETEQHILSVNDQLQPETGAQIVVAAIDFLDGMSSEEYAYQLFNEWGIGSSEKNNGVLFLLSPGEEKYWVTPGRGLESVLSSGVLDKMMDSVRDGYFEEGDYDRFVTEIFDDIAAILAKEYGVALSDTGGSGAFPQSSPTAPSTDEFTDVTHRVFENFVVTAMMILIITFIVIVCVMKASFLPGRRRSRRYRSGPFMPPPPPPPRGPRGPMGGGRPMGGPTPPRRSSWSGGSFGGGSRSSGGFRSSGSAGSRSSGGSRAPRSGGGGGSRGGGAGRR